MDEHYASFCNYRVPPLQDLRPLKNLGALADFWNNSGQFSLNVQDSVTNKRVSLITYAKILQILDLSLS